MVSFGKIQIFALSLIEQQKAEFKPRAAKCAELLF